MASATVAAYNSSIRTAVSSGRADIALSIFSQMCGYNLRPDHSTFPLLAKSCAMLSDYCISLLVHGYSFKLPFFSDMYVQTAFCHMYLKSNSFTSARQVFDEMPQKDITSWNVILSGCAMWYLPHAASLLLHEMALTGLRLDPVTLITLAQLVTTVDRDSSLNSLMAVHCIGLSTGMIFNVSVTNTLVSAYSKSGDLGSAMAIFSGICPGSRTVISWNAAISGCSCCQNHVSAFQFYVAMLHEGIRPDASTLLGLISSCVQGMTALQGRLVHCHALKEGCDMDVTVSNTLMWMYVKCGGITSARILFEKMGWKRTQVSWSVLIDGYAKEGDMAAAVSLFRSMGKSGMKPDSVMVISLLAGCGLKGDLELGRWMNKFAFFNGMKRDVMVCNSFIDMYSKCGDICSAREIFHTMSEKSVVSWTSMIMGCALNGEFVEGYRLFVSMRGLRISPNCVTFLAVLQGCSHGGMLEEGWECFHLMRKVYGIEPGLDHYSCMITLLCRRGRLREALELVESMPVEPDSGIWGTLLCACRLHHDLKLGEWVADRLIELEPWASAPYMEMASLYACSGRWDGVARTRKVMRMSGIQKFPGQSLIHLSGGDSQAFTAENFGHLKFSFFRDLVRVLDLHMKSEGVTGYLEEFFEYDLD